MSSDYQLTIEEKERIKDMLSKKRQVLPELFEQVKVHEEKYKDMQQLQQMEGKVADLKKDLAWAMVGEKKAELDNENEMVEHCKAKLPEYEKKVNETIAAEKEVHVDYVTKGEEINSFNEEVCVI